MTDIADGLLVRNKRTIVVFRVWARRFFAFLLFAAPIAGANAAESVLYAALKAAPNVPPVVEERVPMAEESTEEVHEARRVLQQNPIYDKANPDYDRLQRIDEATRHMTRDAIGFPDWMKSLRAGTINPRSSLSGDEGMQLLNLDIVMRNTKEMPYVRFPHLSHTLWLDCSNCHPAPFLPKAGANQLSMSEIFRGKYCGMCHDRVAFITFFSCDRCHSVPQASAPPTR